MGYCGNPASGTVATNQCQFECRLSDSKQDNYGMSDSNLVAR